MNLDFFKKNKYVYLIIFGVVKKLVYFIIFLVGFYSCSSDEQDHSFIKQDLIDMDIICNSEHEPVCGCNDKTYSNECEAIKRGVIQFEMGVCTKNDND